MHKHLLKVVGLLCVLAGTSLAAEKLYVFYPTIVRPQVIQQNLSKACPDAEVMVFGRYNDFIAKIAIDSPEVIITKPVVTEQMAGYSLKLNGAFKGAADESYVILSVNEKLDVASVKAETVIGMIDFLGRKEMMTFIAQFFPTAPKLKRVTKIEDLLPLLTFNMAQGILISEREVSYFKATSNLNFVITPLPKKVGIVALAVKDGKTSPEILKAIKGLDAETSGMLGVDQWK
jgi:hypothetical protein